MGYDSAALEALRKFDLLTCQLERGEQIGLTATNTGELPMFFLGAFIGPDDLLGISSDTPINPGESRRVNSSCGRSIEINRFEVPHHVAASFKVEGIFKTGDGSSHNLCRPKDEAVNRRRHLYRPKDEAVNRRRLREQQAVERELFRAEKMRALGIVFEPDRDLLAELNSWKRRATEAESCLEVMRVAVTERGNWERAVEARDAEILELRSRADAAVRTGQRLHNAAMRMVRACEAWQDLIPQDGPEKDRALPQIELDSVDPT